MKLSFVRRDCVAWTVVALATTIAAASGCAPSGGSERVTFVFGQRVTSIDLLIGIERGHFARHGIDVALESFDGTTETLPSLAQGRVDVAPTGAFSAAYLNVIARGAPIRLVAARAVHRPGPCGYAAVLARGELLDSGRLTDPASLRGLRVDLDRSNAQYFYWSRLLSLGGLRMSDVEPVLLPVQMKRDALLAGAIDVTIATEPSQHAIVSSGAGSVWKHLGEIAPNRQNTFLLFGPRLLRERRDLGRRVLAGWLDAVREYAREGKSERNVELLARLTGMPAAHVRELCWPTWSTDGRIDPSGLDELQQWALADGLIDAVVPYEGLVDEGFLGDPP